MRSFPARKVAYVFLALLGSIFCSVFLSYSKEQMKRSVLLEFERQFHRRPELCFIAIDYHGFGGFDWMLQSDGKVYYAVAAPRYFYFILIFTPLTRLISPEYHVTFEDSDTDPEFAKSAEPCAKFLGKLHP